jgi:hypothetical protein
MTYSVGGLIQSLDFNNLVAINTPNINGVWASGVADSGYGQPAIATVTTGSIVTTNPWTSALAALNNAALHQGTAVPTLVLPVTGNIIAFYTALQSNLLTVSNNRFNLATAGTDVTTTATRTTAWGNGQGLPTVTSTTTITFPSVDAARYYFNSGGTVRMSFSRTGGTGTPQDLAWTQLLQDVGTVGLPASNTAATVAGAAYQGLTKFGGGGEAPNIYNRFGFYQMPTTPSVMFRQTVEGTSVYTEDNIRIDIGQTGAVLTIICRFTDTDPVGENAVIDGSLAVNITLRPPSTTYIANTWGTPTVSVSAPA